MPNFIFTQQYYQKLKEMRFDFSTKQNRIVVDKQRKNLLLENNQDIFIIDETSLKKEIATNFGKTVPLVPKLSRVYDGKTQIKVETYNRQIDQVLAKPVEIYFEKSPKLVTELTEAELQDLLVVDYDQEKNQLSVGINEGKLTQKTKELEKRLYLNNDLQLDKAFYKQSLVSLISQRFNGSCVNSIFVRLIKKPNTNGLLAERYIEIDLSQQNMYLWEKGKNIAVYQVSSGLYYPTPPGEYKILNKAINAYSDIYHVWMPYWMAFSLDKKLNAYLGIHELPYYYDSTGTEIRRPRDFIGSPHTGGCVSLDIGKAELVYNWAQVGMPVLIFD